MFWIKIWISLFITTIRNFYGQSLIRILQIHFDSVSRALFWVKNFQVNIAHSQFHKRENKMKFFTCCSNKIETQTVEPQVLPEQNHQPQATQTQKFEDANFTPQSLNDVSVFDDFSDPYFKFGHFQFFILMWIKTWEREREGNYFIRKGLWWRPWSGIEIRSFIHICENLIFGLFLHSRALISFLSRFRFEFLRDLFQMKKRI